HARETVIRARRVQNQPVFVSLDVYRATACMCLLQSAINKPAHWISGRQMNRRRRADIGHRYHGLLRQWMISANEYSQRLDSHDFALRHMLAIESKEVSKIDFTGLDALNHILDFGQPKIQLDVNLGMRLLEFGERIAQVSHQEGRHCDHHSPRHSCTATA